MQNFKKMHLEKLVWFCAMEMMQWTGLEIWRR